MHNKNQPKQAVEFHSTCPQCGGTIFQRQHNITDDVVYRCLACGETCIRTEEMGLIEIQTTFQEQTPTMATEAAVKLIAELTQQAHRKYKTDTQSAVDDEDNITERITFIKDGIQAALTPADYTDELQTQLTAQHLNEANDIITMLRNKDNTYQCLEDILDKYIRADRVEKLKTAAFMRGYEAISEILDTDYSSNLYDKDVLDNMLDNAISNMHDDRFSELYQKYVIAGNVGAT